MTTANANAHDREPMWWETPRPDPVDSAEDRHAAVLRMDSRSNADRESRPTTRPAPSPSTTGDVERAAAPARPASPSKAGGGRGGSYRGRDDKRSGERKYPHLEDSAAAASNNPPGFRALGDAAALRNLARRQAERRPVNARRPDSPQVVVTTYTPADDVADALVVLDAFLAAMLGHGSRPSVNSDGNYSRSQAMATAVTRAENREALLAAWETGDTPDLVGELVGRLLDRLPSDAARTYALAIATGELTQ